MRDRFRSDISFPAWDDESTVSPTYFSSGSRDSQGSQSYRPPYVWDGSDDDATPTPDVPPGIQDKGQTMSRSGHPERLKGSKSELVVSPKAERCPSKLGDIV
ncbi:MAG: hypothetical protein M1840_003895 [Geoglossum simile]|nr:MAG: hypothetical protein M1840_003895 [Geoglossum simile]